MKYTTKGTAKATKKSINEFWSSSPISTYLNINGENCFACGLESTTDRAHIFPKQIGGSAKVSNLHLLCKKCHHESELLEGVAYWCWIALKASLWNEGTIIPLEKDGNEIFLEKPHLSRKLMANIGKLETYYHLSDWNIFPKAQWEKYQDDLLKLRKKNINYFPVVSKKEFIFGLFQALIGNTMPKFIEESREFILTYCEQTKNFLEEE